MNNSDRLAATLGKTLEKQGLRISCAESCTGGGIAYAITSISGSSSWFDQSWVTYSNQAKHDLLGVDLALLARYGAVSSQTAESMVAGVVKRTSAQVAVAVTGIAGPDGGTPDKPVGLVWFGFAIQGQITTVAQQFLGSRAKVRQQAIDFALAYLNERLVECGGQSTDNLAG
ncbi:CinA family protein [Alteromonas oceanisediminis]|uniref:CinA family protein n=1 Tax=Alteromonas oceanisediminis TaxID=2836180 RepID=UPI001BDA996C|nr:CinA family protein [Alteromonas oceanisediminis]MBT0585081.1 CinA family protein [Alteromonas oceanisediminis]